MPEENKHYSCLAWITIDSVMRIEKKNYAQVYLEVCKYKLIKTNISKFIEAELESESGSESESKSDTELMVKLESGSDSE